MTEDEALFLPVAVDLLIRPFFSFSVPLFILSLCRIVPFIQMSPFLGSRSIPMVAKIGMAVLLTPMALLYMQDYTKDVSSLGFLCVKEIFVGYTIGIFSSMPFYVVMMSGSLIDHQRGSSSLMLTDPLLSIQDSPIGILFIYSLATFYWINGAAFNAIQWLLDSFRIFPSDQWLPEKLLQTHDNTVASHIINLLSTTFQLAMEFCAPILISLLMVDTLLGITNRIAPQVQISFMGQSLKAFMGLFTLALCCDKVFENLAHRGTHWVEKIGELIESFQA